MRPSPPLRSRADFSLPKEVLMTRLRLLLALATALPWLVGCGEQDQICTYEAPKSSRVAAVEREAAPSRMIAAMLRGDNRAWFFKAMAEEEAMAPVADAMMAYLKSIRFDKEAAQPIWETPAGWQEEPAQGMRLATLKVSSGEQAIELSVIGLPFVGEWDTQVLGNVNRWRGQLNLDAISLEDVGQLETIDLDGRSLVMVDLRGTSSGSGMSAAPMMGGGMGMGAGHPPISSSPSGNPPVGPPATEGPLKYDLPEGWTELAPTSMRLANLSVGEGADQVEVTVSSMPAVMSTLSVVNVWRGDLGLGPVDQQQSADSLTQVEVGDGEAEFVEMTSVEGDRMLLGAVLVRGDRVWLLKIRGAEATVTAQRDAFRQWLGSISFDQ